MRSFLFGLCTMLALTLASGLVLERLNEPTTRQSTALQFVHLESR